MNLSDFDYFLDESLIAQLPAQKRENSRLLYLNRSKKTFEDKVFSDIVNLLSQEDLLVLNNTKVFPARIIGNKKTGAKIEMLLLKNIENSIWEVLIKPAKRLKNGDEIKFSEELSAKLLNKNDETCLVELHYEGNLYTILDKIGIVPLPPYIHRNENDKTLAEFDKQRYQTVFAKNEGSAAAPTAGLHFTNEILEKIKQKGIKIAYVTLNVGLGTFRPVKCENILEHKMHSEAYEITQENADLINSAIKNGKNIVAVGTTSVRTLETVAQKYNKIVPCQGESELFIYPGFEFKVVNKILTNFHLPKSTLLMLVSAFAGREFILEAYKHAVTEKYRFFSYGDCMFIE